MSLGPMLTFDNETEKCVGNAEADKYLTREYRPGIEVPAVANLYGYVSDETKGLTKPAKRRFAFGFET